MFDAVRLYKFDGRCGIGYFGEIDGLTCMMLYGYIWLHGRCGIRTVVRLMVLLVMMLYCDIGLAGDV